MWTGENVAALRQGWAEGLTGGEIAKQRLPAGMFTRQAVIGKARRLGLARRAPVAPPIPNRGRRHGGIRKFKVKKGGAMLKPEPIAPLNIPFLETRPGQCKAITDATRWNQRCCGHPIAADGDVYCPAHKALHYTGRGKTL